MKQALQLRPAPLCAPARHASARSPRLSPCRAQAGPRESGSGTPVIASFLERAGRAALGVAASALLLVGSPATAEVLTFPVSPNPEVVSVQRTLVEAWTIVTEGYVDPTFNGADWMGELGDALTTSAEASTPEEAQKQIGAMLGKLGDPFTRWVPPQEYADFRVGSDGEVQGVGLLIASDPSSGRLVVLSPISGSPAERAGILPGDQVLSVDGTSTEGWDNETAARHLRGSEGSAVWVEVARPREQIPGLAGDRYADEALERKRFRLRRERLEFSPVFAAPMQFDGHTFGYVRLVNFSSKAAEEMKKSIAQLQRDGAEGYILDLRNNPGGLVTSSLDIASLWLDGGRHPTIFNVEDRDGSESTVAHVQLDQGRATTDLPLIVLVNKQSASASEILAAALHDNHRGVVLGESTFGKGKIQSVFELRDGSALFVTVAKYKTPLGYEIDQVGVKPDMACSPVAPGEVRKETITGIPVGPGASERVIEELGTDDCVLTAEGVLAQQVDGYDATYWKARGVPAPAVAATPAPRPSA